jgi:putative inorganic carbon (hco3(-)) transporter
MNFARLTSFSWEITLSVCLLLVTIAATAYRPAPETPVLVVVGVATLIFSLGKPFVIVLAFISLSLFRLHEVYPLLNQLRLPLIFAVLSVVTLAWNYFGTRKIKPRWTPELQYFAFFFIIVTLGLPFAVNRQLAFESWNGVYSKIGVMTLAIAWLATSQRDFLNASKVFIVAGVCIAIAGLQNWMLGIDLVEGTRVTIGSTRNEMLGDPNDLALVLLFPLGFTLAGIAPGVRRSHQLMCALALPLLLLAIVATQSRGALLGTLAVFAVFASRIVRSKAGLLFGCVAVGFILFVAMDISNRASGGSSGPAIDESADGRLAAWKAAANMAISRPLTGVGLNNFAPSFYAYKVDDIRRDIAPHSTWFGILGETGILGLFFFVVFVLSSLRSALTSERLLKVYCAPAEMTRFATAIVASLSGFCVSGSFLTQGFSWPIYILSGLAAGLSVWVQKNVGLCEGTKNQFG